MFNKKKKRRNNKKNTKEIVRNFKTYDLKNGDQVNQVRTIEISHPSYVAKNSNSETIFIRYQTDIDKIESIKIGDMIDLRAAEDIELKAGDFKIISLGVSMKLPDGYEAHMYPRSSTYKNFGIIMANGVGVIDNSYCGNFDVWGFPAIALRDTVIHKNDRICQFRIVKNQPKIVLREVDDLGNKSRGGFGSSGVN